MPCLNFTSNQIGGILGKPASTKIKIITTETLHLVTFIKMAISVGRFLKRKTM